MPAVFGVRRRVGRQPTPTPPAGRRQNAFHAAALVSSAASSTGRSAAVGGAAGAGAGGAGGGLGVAGDGVGGDGHHCVLESGGGQAEGFLPRR